MPPRGGERPSETGDRRSVVYCIVPRDLADALYEPLRRHFRDDPAVEVVVESRGRERRRSERRAGAGPEPAVERRLIKGSHGRRIADRRAMLAQAPAPSLPRKARPHADRLSFVERLEPSDERLEDLDTARLVTRIQAGEQDLVGDLYMRYFDRVFAYLRAVVRDTHEAEDLTQQVFLKVLQNLPRYERRSQPFRAWLFTIVRNHAVSHLQKHGRLTVTDPSEVSAQRDRCNDVDGNGAEGGISTLDWITDRDLTLFVERLPQAQRQVIVLRFAIGLDSAETAKVLGRTPGDVRKLQSRALLYLRERLAAARSRGEGRVRRDRTVLRARKQAPVLRMRRFALTRW